MPTKELTQARANRVFSLLHVGGLSAREISRRVEWSYSTVCARLRERIGDMTISEYARGVRARRAIILRRAFGMGPVMSAKVMGTTRQRIHWLLVNAQPCGDPLVVGRLMAVIEGTTFERDECVSIGWIDDKRAIVRSIMGKTRAFYVPWNSLLDRLSYIGLITGGEDYEGTPTEAAQEGSSQVCEQERHHGTDQ